MHNQTTSICLLDELRAAQPELGFAAYAYEPGGPVTFEIHTPEGEVFAFQAPTLAEAIAAAFPPADDAPHNQTVDIFD